MIYEFNLFAHSMVIQSGAKFSAWLHVMLLIPVLDWYCLQTTRPASENVTGSVDNVVFLFQLVF